MNDSTIRKNHVAWVRFLSVKVEFILVLLFFSFSLIAYHYKLDVKNILLLNQKSNLCVGWISTFLISFISFMYFYAFDRVVSVVFISFEELFSGLFRNSLFGICLSAYVASYAKVHPFLNFFSGIIFITCGYFILIFGWYFLKKWKEKGAIAADSNIKEKSINTGERDMTKETQGQGSNKSKEDSIGESINYLKKVINFSGRILVLFLIIFIVGIFLTRCSDKNYTNSLASIKSATQYQPINKMELESSGQIVTSLTAINNNNEVLKDYLDKNVKNQFDNVGSSIGALNNQISMLYTLLNNSLMIISIILGMFTLIIAILGFYVSKVISEKYDEIKAMNREINISANTVNSSKDNVVELKASVDKSLMAVNSAKQEVDKSLMAVNLAKQEVDESLIAVNSAKQKVDQSLKNVNLVSEKADESVSKVQTLKQEVEDYINENNDILNKRIEQTKRMKKIAMLKQDPELINIFYNDMLLEIEKYSYEDLSEISYKRTYDKDILAKYRHLILINKPMHFLKTSSNVEAIVILSPEISNLYFSYDTAVQVINALIKNMSDENKDSI